MHQSGGHGNREFFALLGCDWRNMLWQMACRLLAYNAEHWLANRLNTYLGGPDEYRAITPHLLHTSGVVHYRHDSTSNLPLPTAHGTAAPSDCSSTNSAPPRHTSPAPAPAQLRPPRTPRLTTPQTYFRRSERAG